MPKFRKVDDLYGRFLDHVDFDEIPIATIDKDGNTVVMTPSEYEAMLQEETDEQEEKEHKENEIEK